MSSRVQSLLIEFIRRKELSESLTPEEFLREHPEGGKELEESLLALAAVDDVLRSLAGSNQVDIRSLGAVDRFELKEKLGTGGMGTVFLAYDPKLKRDVALKVLRSLSLGEVQAQARFEQESHVIAKLEHSAIVPIYEVGESKGTHFIVMQYLDGVSLDQLITFLQRRFGEEAPDVGVIREWAKLSFQLPPSESSVWSADSYVEFVVKVVEQVGNAVVYAHSQGILHRDLKPSNIMLTRDGRVVLFDFGLSQYFEGARLTVTGQFLGTPFYAAPEQLLDGHRSEVSALTDVYALGVTLYELLLLDLPYPGKTFQEVLRAMDRGQTIFVRNRKSLLHRDLVTIVDKAIDPNPKNRYGSMQDFVSDLRAFLQRRPIQASPPSWARKFAYFLRRILRRPSILLPVLVFAFVGIGAVGTIQWDRGRKLEAKRVFQEALVEKSRWSEEKYEAALRRAFELDPSEGNYLWALVEIWKGKDPKKALQIAEEGIAGDPDHIDLLVAKGDLLAIVEGREASVKYFEKIWREHQGNPVILFVYGSELLASDPSHAQKVREMAEEGLAIHESNQAKYLLARACEVMGDDECAMAEYRNFVNTSENVGVVANVVAGYFFEKKAYEDAIKVALLGLHRDYRNAFLHRLLTNTYLRLENWPKVEHHARVYIDMYPDDADMWNRLGLSLHKQNRVMEGVIALRRGRDLEKNINPK